MLCRDTQDWWVMVEGFDKMWSTGEGNGKPLQYSCLGDPMNRMKRQKDRTLKDELPRSVGTQYATGDQWRNNSRKNEGMEPKQKQHPVVDVAGDGSNVRCCKEQYCMETQYIRSMNQGKLKVVKQEMARVNVDFLGISSVQFSHSVMSDSVTSCIAARQASLSITNSQSLLKLMPIESVMPSSHLILCRPLLLLPPNPPSIRDFSNESTLCMRWPKYWSFSFCISLSNEHPGLISFKMDWLDLLAVQGTLESPHQHHSSKASILQCSAFFTVQLSHPYMTTGKTVTLTRWTFVGKVMSLLFNMLSRLVITFLPRSKHLLFHGCNHHLQWFWSPEKEGLTLLPLFPHLFPMRWWNQMPWS